MSVRLLAAGPPMKTRMTILFGTSTLPGVLPIFCSRPHAQSFFEVAVIATDRECRRWQLPKGRLYPTEQPLTAALREVEEETGLETEFESFLKTVHYIYLDTYARTVPERVFKKVDFFSAARSGWASLRCQCRSPKGRMGLSRRRSGAAGIRR